MLMGVIATIGFGIFTVAVASPILDPDAAPKSIQGIIDTDGSGFSDAYEEKYGFNGFDLSPTGDADHDGISNRDEYTFGTNLLDANDYPRLEIGFHDDTLSVFVPAGVYYIVEMRTEETDWEFLFGVLGNNKEEIATISRTELALALRLRAFHVDSDGGGISDYEELLRFGDPNKATDADNDKIPDEFEVAWLGTLDFGAVSDSDSDGVKLYDEWRYKLNPLGNDLQAGMLVLSYDYDRLTSYGPSIVFTFDQAGNLTQVTPSTDQQNASQ